MKRQNTIRTIYDQHYPSYFPTGCPPEDAWINEQLLFRLCRGTKPEKDDFISYYLNDPEQYKGTINAYGLSVMRSREDCLSLIRKYPWTRKYQSIARGLTNEQRGSWKETPSKQNPAHITWWVCKDVDPLSFFQFDALIDR